MKAQRGVYEKILGSNVWWVRYADALGRIRREKAGVKSAAVKLYQKRKTEILEGKKLPEQLRGRVVRFAEIADDALAYCRANNQGQQFDAYRIGRLKDKFGNYPAEIPIETLREWFSEQEWQPGYAQPIQIDPVTRVPVGDREQESVNEPGAIAQTKT